MDYYSEIEYEEFTEEELEQKRMENEVHDIYEYINTVSTDSVFPLFDKLTFDDLYDFITQY